MKQIPELCTEKSDEFYLSNYFFTFGLKIILFYTSKQIYLSPNFTPGAGLLIFVRSNTTKETRTNLFMHVPGIPRNHPT